jgi:hypothetical protein
MRNAPDDRHRRARLWTELAVMTVALMLIAWWISHRYPAKIWVGVAAFSIVGLAIYVIASLLFRRRRRP